MLIQIIEDILRPKLEALPWVDHFGGLAQAHTRTISTDPLVTKVYPVSVIPSVDCPPQQDPMLSPDHRKRSVLWIEPSGDASGSLDERFAKRNVYTYTQNFRLVGWLNGKKLGEQDPTFSDQAVADLMRTLLIRMSNRILTGQGLDEDLPLIKLKVEPIGIQARNVQTIFAPYSMRVDQAKFFTHPHDFFGIVFRATFTVPVTCPIYTPAPPIVCDTLEDFFFGGLMIGADVIQSTPSTLQPSSVGVMVDSEGTEFVLNQLVVRIDPPQASTVLSGFDLRDVNLIDVAAVHRMTTGTIQKAAIATGRPVAVGLPHELDQPNEGGVLKYDDALRQTVYVPNDTTLIQSITLYILYTNLMKNITI